MAFAWYGAAGGQGRTERVPQDQSKLRNLLALLAQLQESLLAGVFTQQIRNVAHGAAVVLGHVWVLGGGVLVDGIEAAGVIRIGSHGAVMLLGSSGGSLLLSMLVVRLLLLDLLLLHPGRGFLRIVVLAAIHGGGMVGHHLDGRRGGPRWRAKGRDGRVAKRYSRAKRWLMETETETEAYSRSRRGRGSRFAVAIASRFEGRVERRVLRGKRQL